MRRICDLLIVTALAALTASAQGITRTWNGGSGPWSDPASWMPVGVPEAEDEIRIDAGSVQLNGSVTVGHRLTWTGGSLHSGSLRIAPGAAAVLEGSGDKLIQNFALANAGAVRIIGGRLGCVFTGYSQSVVITNEAGGQFELVDAASVDQVNSGGWPAALRFVNRGTLRSQGNATNRIQDLPLDNQGVIEIAEGRLIQRGGGQSSGRWAVSAGAVSEWQGGAYTLTEAQIAGPGPTVLNGSITLQGVCSADWFELQSGSVNGTAEIRSGFRWTGGGLSGAQIRLGAGDHWITGDNGQSLHHSVLVNAGRLIADEAVLSLLFTGYSQSALVTNETGGVLELRGGTRLRQANPSGWNPAGLVLANEGTLRSSGVATNSLEQIPLNNRGTLDILDGTLRHTGGGISPGTFGIAAKGRFELSGGAYQFNGSHWTGPGPGAVVGDTTLLGDFLAEHFRLEQGDVGGDCRIRGGFHWTGGTLVGAQVRLGPGQHRIAGAETKTLLNSSLANAGHLVFEAATVGLQFTGYNQTAVLTNEAGSQLDLLGGARLEQRNGGGWTPAQIGLINAGVLRKLGGETATLAAVPLLNHGLCEVPAGTLRIEGNATFADVGQLTVGLGNQPALQVTGAATLAGRLQADAPPGFDVTAGATFTPLTAGTIDGRFANAITLNPGHVYQYVNGYAANTLTLTAENGLAQPVRLVVVALTGDQFHGEIHGQAGLIYLLESSPDFAPWQLEQRLTAAADIVTVGQPILNEPARFFRVRLLP